MNFFSSKKILIISTEAWSHIPVSKHHYSTALSKLGAKVFFLNPPSNQNKIVAQKDNPNLSVIDYTTVRGTNTFPSFIRNMINRKLIKKIKPMTGDIDVVWSFDPYRFQNLDLFGAALKIYHPVDVHAFSLENEIARAADIILSVSDLILKKYEPFKALKQKINHGLQSQFITPPAITSTVANAVGYVGNLDNFCIDIKTLLRIVKENNDITFHFIGPHKINSPLAEELRQLANCKLIGRVPSTELPKYFAAVDFFLMCYDGASKEINSNHHKIIEFLSTGKPVVMNFTDEYTNKRDIVSMSENNNELPVIFKKVVSEYIDFIHPEVIKKRIEFAQGNTYTAHVERIASLAEQVTKNKS